MKRQVRRPTAPTRVGQYRNSAVDDRRDERESSRSNRGLTAEHQRVVASVGLKLKHRSVPKRAGQRPISGQTVSRAGQASLVKGRALSRVELKGRAVGRS